MSNCGLNFEQKQINGITVPACIWIHSLVVIYLRGRQIAERQKREKKRDNVAIEKSLKICLFDMDNAQKILFTLYFIILHSISITCILAFEIQSLIEENDNILEKV